MKYTIHIIDDEFSGRTAMKILLEKVFYQHIESLTISKSFDDAKTRLDEHNYDIIFLDINLKGISAFDLMSLIPSTSRVIFVTAYSEFMLKAIRNKAFDYLVKPVKEEDLKECLLRIQKESGPVSEQSYLSFKNKGITRLIRQNEIVYIKGNGPYSIINTVEETFITSRTLKTIITELENHFVRIHKTYVVNTKFIKGFNKDTLILTNNECLPISRTGSKNLSSLH
jgi:two-component system LytT family response regulator